MNKKRNLTIIFGFFVLSLIVIFGLRAYYQERESQVMLERPEEINFQEFFDQNYPISSEEAMLFIENCADINSMISGQGQEFKPLLCMLMKDKTDVSGGKSKVTPTPFEKMSSLPQGQYIAIAVNYNDLLQKNISTVISDGSFEICVVTEPALIDPFREELSSDSQIMVYDYNIVFPEGEIFCSKFSNLPLKTTSLLISGFIPEALESDLFEAKIYLVSENEEVEDSSFKESFSNIEETLQSYPLLWEVKKPII
jgi:hypothetical protein